MTLDNNTPRFITRKQLAARWSCCEMTLKRREADGTLHPIRLSGRMVRYRLSDIECIESEKERTAKLLSGFRG